MGRRERRKKVKMRNFRGFDTSFSDVWGILSARRCLGDRSQTLVGGLMQKGSLRSFDPPKEGGLGEMTTNLLGKIEFIWFSAGLTHNFHVKKGALKFLRSKRRPLKFTRRFYFASASPTSVCERYLEVVWLSNRNYHKMGWFYTFYPKFGGGFSPKSSESPGTVTVMSLQLHWPRLGGVKGDSAPKVFYPP